jgi:hypothetical protein
VIGRLSERAGFLVALRERKLYRAPAACSHSSEQAGDRTDYTAQLGGLVPLIDWTSRMAGFWQSRFDHLEALLKRLDQ